MAVPPLRSPFEFIPSPARGLRQGGTHVANSVHTTSGPQWPLDYFSLGIPNGKVKEDEDDEDDEEDEFGEDEEESEEDASSEGDEPHDSGPDAAGYPISVRGDIEKQLLMDFYQISENKNSSELDATLALWNKYNATSSTGSRSWVIDRLRDKYKDEPLRLDALKGEDRILVEAVKQACDKAGFVVLLAKVERKKHGAVRLGDADWQLTNTNLRSQRRNGSKRCRYTSERDHDDWDLRAKHEIGKVWEEECHLTQVCDTEGRTFTGKVEIGEDSFLEHEPFDERNPDEEEYPAGYDSCSRDLVTHWWRPRVMIIVDPTEMLGLLDIHPGWGGSTEEEQSIAENNFYICIRYLINKMTQSDINIYRDHFTEICTIIVKHNTNPEMHPADHIPVWFCPNLLVGAITLKDTQLCEEIKSAFPSLKELDDDKLLTEVQPYLDEIEDMVDSKALETAAEREAFLSLVQHPETWVSDTLLPRPPLESAGQQEAFLDMMRMFCHRVPEREESTTEASAREKHGIESVLRASVHVQGTKRKAEESAEGLRSAKRGYGTSV